MSINALVTKTNDSFQVRSPERHPLLSIIIPAYNEEHRLPGTLDKIINWSQSLDFSIEILIIENGSQDKTTEVAESYCQRFDYIRVHHSAKGKGAAIHEGMLKGKGENLFICDADLSMPVEEISKFLSRDIEDFDIVIGSREAPGAIRYSEPLRRHIMGRVFNFIVQVIATPGFEDTQCGFKLFRRRAAMDIFSRQTIIGWGFDVEVIYLALKLNYKIISVPISWYYDSDSRVDSLRDSWEMFNDIWRIKLNDLRGLYNKQPSSNLPLESPKISG